MIEADKNELFPITVSLVDETTSLLVGGQVVNYDIRTISDLVLDPPINGILSESSVESGVYRTEVSIPTSGSFICYATCSGFITSTEDIRIKDESLLAVSKYNLPYNISVTDVIRSTISGSETASQLARNVPLNKTDYIVTLIKSDDALDWGSPVSSGISYAHYTSLSSSLPYRMGGPF